MCGLVGITGAPGKKLVNVFSDLIQIDVIRGPHSTGILMVPENNNWLMQKEVGVPQNLMRTEFWHKDIDSFKGYSDIKCLMGHNRWATRGKINSDNAHPFVHGNVVLAHNGTIHNTYELKDWNDPEDRKLDFDTDSELVAFKMDQRGVDWTWKHIDGAAALSWWDDKTNSMNFIRNDKRPFHFAYTEGRKHVIWASEAWMIRGAAARNGLNLQNGVMTLNENYLLTLRWNKKKGIVTSTEKKLDPFVEKVGSALTDHGNYGGHHVSRRASKSDAERYKEWQQDHKITQAMKRSFGTQTTGNGTEAGYEIIDGKVVEYSDDPWKGLRMKDISEEEFRKRYDRCVFCNESVKEEYEECVILDPQTAVCNDCASTAELAKIPLTH